jgi:hypothetical protein
MVQLCVCTTAPLSVQEVSLGEKPVPVTETVAAIRADVGFSVIDADPLDAPKLKVVEAESPSGEPIAVTVYALAAAFATVKEPVNVPSDTEHVSDVTGVPLSEQE